MALHKAGREKVQHPRSPIKSTPLGIGSHRSEHGRGDPENIPRTFMPHNGNFKRI